MTGPGHNSSAEEFHSILRRLEHLDEQGDALNADRAEVFKSAKNGGWNVKAIRVIRAARRAQAKNPSDYATLESDLEMYWALLGTGQFAPTLAPEPARELAPMSGGPREMCFSEVRQLLRDGVRPDQDFRFADASVYFALDEAAGLIKVGVSNDVTRRIAQLEKEGRRSLRLLGAVAGNRRAEMDTHKLLERERVTGEWFSATDDVLAQVASILASAPAHEAA